MRKSTKFIILNENEVDYIDFTEVLQDSPSSLRYSADRSKTFVKYRGDHPDFVFEITNDLVGKREYSHDEFIKVLERDEWIPKKHQH